MTLAFPKPHRIRDPKALVLYKRAHPRCEACQWAMATDAHHLVSRARGGSDVEENLLALCRRCHTAWTGVNRTRRAWLARYEPLMTAEARTKVRRALRLEDAE